jgi:hypothetical protein
MFIDRDSNIGSYIHEDSVELIADTVDKLRPPLGYKCAKTYIPKFERRKITIDQIVREGRKFMATHPDSVQIFLDSNGTPKEHISPEMHDYLLEKFKIPKDSADKTKPVTLKKNKLKKKDGGPGES